MPPTHTHLLMSPASQLAAGEDRQAHCSPSTGSSGASALAQEGCKKTENAALLETELGPCCALLECLVLCVTHTRDKRLCCAGDTTLTTTLCLWLSEPACRHRGMGVTLCLPVFQFLGLAVGVLGCVFKMCVRHGSVNGPQPSLMQALVDARRQWQHVLLLPALRHMPTAGGCACWLVPGSRTGFFFLHRAWDRDPAQPSISRAQLQGPRRQCCCCLPHSLRRVAHALPGAQNKQPGHHLTSQQHARDPVRSLTTTALTRTHHHWTKRDAGTPPPAPTTTIDNNVQLIQQHHPPATATQQQQPACARLPPHSAGALITSSCLAAAAAGPQPLPPSSQPHTCRIGWPR